jgi:hypothetical protein
MINAIAAETSDAVEVDVRRVEIDVRVVRFGEAFARVPFVLGGIRKPGHVHSSNASFGERRTAAARSAPRS